MIHIDEDYINTSISLNIFNVHDLSLPYVHVVSLDFWQYKLEVE